MHQTCPMLMVALTCWIVVQQRLYPNGSRGYDEIFFRSQLEEASKYHAVLSISGKGKTQQTKLQV